MKQLGSPISIVLLTPAAALLLRLSISSKSGKSWRTTRFPGVQVGERPTRRVAEQCEKLFNILPSVCFSNFGGFSSSSSDSVSYSISIF